MRVSRTWSDRGGLPRRCPVGGARTLLDSPWSSESLSSEISGGLSAVTRVSIVVVNKRTSSAAWFSRIDSSRMQSGFSSLCRSLTSLIRSAAFDSLMRQEEGGIGPGRYFR